MTDPLFTIAIPTFNRCGFLKESLSVALSQSYPNIQVLVCDNASTDSTADMVRSLNDARVKYHRNESNIGANRNFALSVKLADGDFFSWLQDDDLVVHDFVEHAVDAMLKNDGVLYLGTVLSVPSERCLHNPLLCGPPSAMDWLKPMPRVVAPETIIALSYLMSFAIPPVIAFRTDVLRHKVPSLQDFSYPLLWERSIVCDAAMNGVSVIDPRICGVFRKHSQQSSHLWLKEKNRYKREWLSMANYLETLVTADSIRNCSELTECFLNIPSASLELWLDAAARWDPSLQAAMAVREVLISAGRSRGLSSAFQSRTELWVKRASRRLTPPCLSSVVDRALSFAMRKP